MTGDLQELARSYSVSYRQADHWARRGYLGGPPLDPGSGRVRTLDEQQARRFAAMARLVRAGFVVEEAAKVAAELVDNDLPYVRLQGGVTVVVADRPLTVGVSVPPDVVSRAELVDIVHRLECSDADCQATSRAEGTVDAVLAGLRRRDKE